MKLRRQGGLAVAEKSEDGPLCEQFSQVKNTCVGASEM